MDVTQAVELVKKDFFNAIATVDDNEPAVMSALAEVVTLDPGGASGYGDKEYMVGEMGELVEIEPGESYPEDDFKVPWTAYARFRKFGSRLRIHEDDYAAIAANGKVGAPEIAAAVSWARNWANQEEQLFVDIINNGRLAAGHLKTFNGNHKGETDPYPKFIYDGKPLMALGASGHPLGYDSSQTIGNLTASRAFSHANLSTALTEFKTDMAVTDRGRDFNHAPTHILAHWDNEEAVRTVLQSRQKSGSANNDTNTLENAVLPLFTSKLGLNASWYLCRAQYGCRVFRTPGVRGRVWVDDDTKDIVIDVDARWGHMQRNWRWISGHNAAAS